MQQSSVRFSTLLSSHIISMNKSDCLYRSWLWHGEAVWVFTIVCWNAADPACAGSLVIPSSFGADLKVTCLESLIASLLLGQLCYMDTLMCVRQYSSPGLPWTCQICASKEVAPRARLVAWSMPDQLRALLWALPMGTSLLPTASSRTNGRLLVDQILLIPLHL